MAVNFNPIDMAKQRSESNGSGGNASFFSLKPEESVVLRFITGMVPSYIVKHSCGLEGVDVNKSKFDEAASAGGQVLCPSCGQPLSAEDIMFERPGVWAADIHNYFPTNEAEKRGNFTCLGSATNAMFGFVPTNEDGSPKYACPACTCQHNYNKKTGSYKKPSMSVYGIAVERELVESTEMINGIPTPVVKDARDVMVEVDGKMVPKLVIVNKGYTGFWGKLGSWSPDYSKSICNYDWRITRHGEKLDTVYDVQLASQTPSIVDFGQYQEYMPDVEAIIKGMGTPEYYVKKGYPVQGFQMPDEAAQTTAGTAQEAMQQAAAQVAQGIPQQAQQPIPAQVQQMQAAPMGIPTAPQTGAGNDWAVVSNQFN